MVNRLILVAVLLATGGASAFAATVAGSIEFVTRRGQKPTVTETLVWLEADAAVKPRKAESVQMLTRGKTLLPHVLAVPVGSTVFFPNEDPITHNLFSVSQPNPFDLGLYRRGAGKSQVFEKAGMVNVYCNVHPNMSGVIHVMATPWYAFADQAGSFSIPDVPPGKYSLTAWNELTGQTSVPFEVGASGVSGGPLRVKLDGRTVRNAPHMNKHGRPYQQNRSKDY